MVAGIMGKSCHRVWIPDSPFNCQQEMEQHSLSRRDYLMLVASSALATTADRLSIAEETSSVKTKSVAGVITVYRPGSHADVLIGKILEGWNQDGGAGPALRLVSMYVDQFPSDDIAREMSRKHSVPIFDSIEKALTLGGDRLAVDGVISIGEHGDYPWNEKEQHLYPRRRFFEEITDTFTEVQSGRAGVQRQAPWPDVDRRQVDV